ncbi:TPA: SsrA-binding protein SmpB [Vibrio vulnificus]|uniref:SsrA-binding protein n=1 Tax=Vibrio vulnificus TaxID=672 RepID=A0A8H9MYE2_VIBVL|nr:SsrA-binding protein SmpB [Vibrio vulnificus]HAS8538438.1 SsrA-binding protein SmpB [Vibrio vulnificus]
MNKVISVNRSARHDYFVVEEIKCGIVLKGWEVKGLIQNGCSLKQAYVTIHDGEVYLRNLTIMPTVNTCSHIKPIPDADRKLLLTKKQIGKLIGEVQVIGNTLIPLSVERVGSLIKVNIALAKGKKNYDKRNDLKNAEWKRKQEKILKRAL